MAVKSDTGYAATSKSRGSRTESEGKGLLVWAPERVCVKDDRPNPPADHGDASPQGLLKRLQAAMRGTQRSAYGLVCGPCVREETPCKYNAELFSEGCSRGCRVNALEVVCIHEEVVPRLATGGLIALLVTALSVALFVCSFAGARSYAGLVFAATAAMTLLTVMVVLSGVAAARRTALAQVSIALTLAGAMVLAPYDGAVVAVVCGIAAVVIASLVLGMIGEQQLSGLVRFTLITGAVGMCAAGIAALPLWRAGSTALLISGFSMALAFAGSWLREAAQTTLARGLTVPGRIGTAPRLHRVKPIKRGRKLRGFLGAIERAAIATMRLVSRIIDGGIVGSQWLLDVSFRSARSIEKRVRRIVIRFGQIAREDYRLMRSWIRSTVTLLDNRFLPAVVGVLLFLGAALALAHGSVELTRYVGSGRGFAVGGWTHLGLLCGLFAAAIVGNVMACATYGDDYLTALESVGNFVLLALPVAIVMVSLVVISGVLGFPVITKLPAVGRLLGDRPYTFGPASAIATGIFAALVAFVVYKIREPQAASPETDEASVGDLIQRLLGSFRELNAGSMLPVVAIAVSASLLTFRSPLDLHPVTTCRRRCSV